MTLVFDDRGERVCVDCHRLSILAADVEAEDYVACPHTGFVHVHEVRELGSFSVLVDCHDHEHMYPRGSRVEVARPLPDVKA